MKLSHCLAGIGLAALGALTACGSDDGGGATGCTKDTDCRAPRVCDQGACVDPGGMGGSGGSTAGGGGSGGGGTGGASGGAGGSGGTGGGGFACGPKASATALLYTTLDDAGSITSPASGSGMGASHSTTPTDDFLGGACGSAIQLDETNEYVRFRQAMNFDYAQGTIDFYYQPSYASTDGNNHPLFGTSDFSNGGIRIRKAAANNNNNLQVIIVDASAGIHETQVAPADTPFSPGTWVRVTISWDSAAAGQAVRIYFDGVEATYVSTVNGGFPMPSARGDEFVYIGAFDDRMNQGPSSGLIDDFKIYGTVEAP